ncbi:iron chelate uptake ABC transporter family permease subunit [Enterococcus villorum]|uniref:ABC transporter permease n=2 Tax=Enterococcus villorum TaxID=112904 RepID=A0A511J2D4_9ENTE|nr:iron chelate uptake ABC transporter family permease subunit [Enterococcus villorum]EOH91423.1 iron ABC transporter system permease [Enterococcus villorum ATCC 700913]EOW76801.1 iron ABC transporter system permease [Enterococcus villorum ATCC 700913]GEL91839.1 ABC transporter permease [Enterococcus villorum]
MLKKKGVFIGLVLSVVLVVGCYLTINTYGNWQFAWTLRSKKVFAFMLVSLATSSATISFQTITQNQFLTPSILGLDSLYVLVQTILFFVLGGVTMLQQTGVGFFLANIAMMVGLSQLLFYFLLKKGQTNLFLLLMTGVILGTLFRSVSTFLQVVMDPNEYDLLQGKLFANFGNIPNHYLLPAALLIGCTWLLLFSKYRYLDVFHLGHSQAINLGIDTDRFQFFILCCVSLLTGTATALVGPVTFLGFIVANVSYQLFATYRHSELFLGSFFVSLLFLAGGQLFVEQIFRWNTTVSVIVEFLGGLYFMSKLVRERKSIG